MLDVSDGTNQLVFKARDKFASACFCAQQNRTPSSKVCVPQQERPPDAEQARSAGACES